MALIERYGEYGAYWGNTMDSSNTLTPDRQKLNAEYIWAALQDDGWTLNAVAGMLGNMQSESAINPGRWQSDRVGGDPEGHGYGLVQWTPYTKYTNWAQNNGFNDYSTMDANLARIKYEVANGLQWIATSSFPMSFEDFKTSTDDPYTLAMAFIANYERPADPNQPARGTQAEAWFEYLGGVSPPTKKKEEHFKFVLFTGRRRRNTYG